MQKLADRKDGKREVKMVVKIKMIMKMMIMMAMTIIRKM